MQSKRTYQSPRVEVIHFDLCESLMFLPQSESGTSQMSPDKSDVDYGNASWDEVDSQD